jgi:hypothetical protein
MREPRRPTILQASTACYKDNFIIYLELRLQVDTKLPIAAIIIRHKEYVILKTTNQQRTEADKPPEMLRLCCIELYLVKLLIVSVIIPM